MQQQDSRTAPVIDKYLRDRMTAEAAKAVELFDLADQKTAAEDIAQEIAADLTAAAAKNPPSRANFRTWAKHVIHRRAYRHAATRAREQLTTDYIAERFPAACSDDADEDIDNDPEAPRLDYAEAAAIRELIDNLPDRPRRLALALMENPSIAAARKAAGIGKTAAFECMAVIRRAFGEAGFSEPF